MAKEDPTDKMLDELLKGKTPEEILGEEGLLKDLTRRLVNRALAGEMTARRALPFAQEPNGFQLELPRVAPLAHRTPPGG